MKSFRWHYITLHPDRTDLFAKTYIDKCAKYFLLY